MKNLLTLCLMFYLIGTYAQIPDLPEQLRYFASHTENIYVYSTTNTDVDLAELPQYEIFRLREREVQRKNVEKFVSFDNDVYSRTEFFLDDANVTTPTGWSIRTPTEHFIYSEGELVGNYPRSEKALTYLAEERERLSRQPLAYLTTFTDVLLSRSTDLLQQGFAESRTADGLTVFTKDNETFSFDPINKIAVQQVFNYAGKLVHRDLKTYVKYGLEDVLSFNLVRTLKTLPSGASYYRSVERHLDNHYIDRSLLPRSVQQNNQGIAQLSVIDLQVQPNPMRDRLDVTWNQKEIEKTFTLRLLDATGKVYEVRSVEPTAGYQRTSFDVSSYPAGFYFLQKIDQSGTVTKRIVKR